MLISCGRDSDPGMMPFLQSLASMHSSQQHINIQIVRYKMKYMDTNPSWWFVFFVLMCHVLYRNFSLCLWETSLIFHTPESTTINIWWLIKKPTLVSSITRGPFVACGVNQLIIDRLLHRYFQLVRRLLSDHSWSGSDYFPACSTPYMENWGPAEPAQGGVWPGLALWVCSAPRWSRAPPRLCIIKMIENKSLTGI